MNRFLTATIGALLVTTATTPSAVSVADTNEQVSATAAQATDATPAEDAAGRVDDSPPAGDGSALADDRTAAVPVYGCAAEEAGCRNSQWTGGDLQGDVRFLGVGGSRLFTRSTSGIRIVSYDIATGEKRSDARIGRRTIRGAAVSPDGRFVYVAPGFDVVEAYDTATGNLAWSTRLTLPALEDDDRYTSRETLTAVAVSPDGSRVYATGKASLNDRIQQRPITIPAVLTVAYDATTGQRLWATQWGERYGFSAGQYGTSVAVSADGSRVYVAGAKAYAPDAIRWVALEYRAVDKGNPAREGERLWTSQYPETAGCHAHPEMEVAPDHSMVYLAGTLKGIGSDCRDGNFDYGTVAFHTGTGEEAWDARFDGGPPPELDVGAPVSVSVTEYPHEARSLAIAPDGGAVYVTGTATSRAVFVDPDTTGLPSPSALDSDFATVAYDAATGAQRWVAYYPQPSATSPATNLFDQDGANAVVAGPNGKRVYVVGRSFPLEDCEWYAQVLLGDLAGPTCSAVRENTGGEDTATLTTVAYDPATGGQVWVDRIPNGASRNELTGFGLAASGGGEVVFSTDGDSIVAYNGVQGGG